jgi:hypothetical protein
MKFPKSDDNGSLLVAAHGKQIVLPQEATQSSLLEQVYREGLHACLPSELPTSSENTKRTKSENSGIFEI